MADQKKQSLFYKDKPVFGLDIGRSSIKAIQIDRTTGKNAKIIGYGNTSFDPKALNNGVIVDPEELARAAYNLITKDLIGTITTRRVALSLPNEHSFSRTITLPKMDSKDIATAVISDAEGSIPIPIDQLYYDYQIMKTLEDGSIEVQLVATSKDIVDSYLVVTDALGLEVAFIETNITAVTRIVAHSEPTDVVSLIIDFGSTAADLSIFDGKTARITGTADCGSDNITDLIAKRLGVSSRQAHTIKTRYGLELSKKQKDIVGAIEDELSKLLSEVRKVIRYYGEHSPESQIGQIIILGGGANLPGLSTYITDHIRVPTRLCNPWQNISFGKLQPPHQLETTLYTTCGGLGLITLAEMKQ